MRQDITYAWRQLGAAPGFSAIAIITFALGIGATTAIFSAVYAVVLQPFPFPEPDRVVAVGEQFQPGGLSAVSPGNFEDWRKHARSFSDLGARRFVSVNVSNGTTPERLIGVAVTASYFSVFRIPAALGRTITADENRAGRERVLVLSHRLWTRMFGSDRSVVGRPIQMDGHAYTVVGVMPREFDRLGGPEEFWVPAVFTAEELASHDSHSMTAVGRLAPGVSLEQAAAELSVVFTRMKAELPANLQLRQGIVNEYAAEVMGESRPRLLLLFGAVALVLLIACGNVAHLLLARGRLRSHEVALRASLGASRGHLVQQLLSESLVLALVGGVLGIAVAYGTIPLLLAVGTEALTAVGVPRLDQTSVNAQVLIFAMSATVLSALATGIVPALRATRLDLRNALNDGSRTVARGKDTLRSLLVAAEVAFAIVLLTGAGLLVRSALYLESVDTGFDGTGVLTARVSLPEAGYEEPSRVEQVFRDLVERLSQHPGIQSAAVSSSVPMAPRANSNGLVPEGKTFDPNDFVLGRLGVITEDYFEALRIPLVAGRVFTVDDRRDTRRVMILSQTAARQLFPGENALGKRVSCCEPGPDGMPLLKEVVGIVADVRTDGPQVESPADFYLPSQQAPADAWGWLQRTVTVVVRGSTADATGFVAVVRAAVADIDPAVPVHSIATMRERLETTLARDRFSTRLMLLLGGIGLVLATIGIYGVIACFVAHRRHELAIRMALGAPTGEIVRMVLNQGMRPVWIGVVLGLVAAAGVSQALASFVYGVTTRDPLTFAAVALLLIAVAMAANLVPARAAARVSPASLLLS